MENNFFKEIKGPNGIKLVIDIESLVVSYENRNLTNFFIESSKNIEEKTALNWLRQVDDATIIMIGQCGNYTVMDVKPHVKTRYANEIVDFTLLTLFIMKWEGLKKYADVADLGKATLNLYYLAMSEAMSRKGFVKIYGSGMISKVDTKVNMTKEGIAFSKNIGSKFYPKNEFLLPDEIINSKDDIGFPRNMTYSSLIGEEDIIEKETAMLKDTIKEHSVDSIMNFNKSPIEEIKKNIDELKGVSKIIEKKNRIKKEPKSSSNKTNKTNKFKPNKPNNGKKK